MIKNRFIFASFLLLATISGPSIITEVSIISIQIPEPKPIVKNPCPKPEKDYNDETYLGVSQIVPLEDQKYIPSDLVPLNKKISKYANLCVKSEVLTPLEHMIADAHIDGKEIIVSSGFRDYDTQTTLVKNRIKETGIEPLLSVAKPGYSEHQLGVAVDLTSVSIASTSTFSTFADTPESAWLEDNAYKYGFIQSYSRGKEKITGYMYEPWHYRYVGIENAKEIITSGETINEFMKRRKILIYGFI
jgi:D-alanyl-D-alanine carboxypeptidase